MHRKEQKERTWGWGTGVGGEGQEHRAAEIEKGESALTFTFPQSSVWAFPL